MPASQLDLPALAKAVSDAYDASIDLALDSATRQDFKDKADALSKRFDQLSGHWFETTTAEFTAASKTLDESLDAMQKPLDDAANAVAALGLLKSLTGALDAVLGLL
ncbi:hypothetical protein [Phenylobacterium sp.]|uniref:hypothetical protein n=1 Tax=Phenylobacterium sp. TaxID=1871053 RepID=UPI0025D2AD1A|nr:hypothetical protein [Phenylobacterium sp.]